MADIPDPTPPPSARSPSRGVTDASLDRSRALGGWLTLAVLVIGGVDVRLFVSKLNSVAEFGMHLALLAAVGACLGLIAVHLPEGRAGSADGATAPIPLEYRWIWLVPLGLVLGEVVFAAASYFVGSNYATYLPPPKEASLEVDGMTFPEIPSVKFLKWSDARWYAEFITGAIAGGLAAVALVRSGIRSATPLSPVDPPKQPTGEL